MGKRDCRSRPTTVRSDGGQLSGWPSDDLDQSCVRISDPVVLPPARKSRDVLTLLPKTRDFIAIRPRTQRLIGVTSADEIEAHVTEAVAGGGRTPQIAK